MIIGLIMNKSMLALYFAFLSQRVHDGQVYSVWQKHDIIGTADLDAYGMWEEYRIDPDRNPQYCKV